MSEVLIPLGGARGKNRGSTVYMDESYTHLKLGDTASMALPLPAGVYKKFKPESATDELPESITSSGDGKNAVIVLEDKLLKKMTLEAFGIASITNFSLSMFAHKQVRLTWAKPTRGLFSGVHFVFKYGSMPTNENDGFMVYDSADVHYETARLEERELFVRAYSYVTVRDGRWYDEGKVSARITVAGISGSVTLSTGAGTWTVPDKVDKIRYILVGHGGSSGIAYTNNVGTGGGGGGYFTTGYLDVSPGQQINWVIPSEQGAPTSFAGIVANSGTTGNDSYFSTKRVYGGNGGSGGGAGSHNGKVIRARGGNGGLDGSDGGQSLSQNYKTKEYEVFTDFDWQNTGGQGQHTSTRGFNGVLYSGGGSGGGANDTPREGGGGVSISYMAYPRKWYAGTGPDYAKACGVNGLGGGGGGMHHTGSGNYQNYQGGSSGEYLGAPGGTGCIYIAWGNLMNDGS